LPPDTCQDQFDAGPTVAASSDLQPRDRLLLGRPSGVEHVGLVMTPGVMIDSPTTAVDVEEDVFPTTVGAVFDDRCSSVLPAHRVAE
jgi:hypothetical protein